MAYPIFPSTGDPVEWATIVGPNGGELSVPDGTDAVDVEWQVFTDRPDCTVYEVLSSVKLPRPGEVLKRYRPTSTGGLKEGLVPTYTAFATITDKLSVANYSCRQDEQHPHVWKITVMYRGSEDPTTVPAQVSSESSEYQTSEWIDADGRPVENSAYDPILGGMPVQRNQRFIRITRNVPWTLWDMDRGAAFENTLNLAPFVLSRQVRMVGTPAVPTAVVLPPGTVRIKRITEQEVVYRPHPVAASRLTHWRVTAELHIDRREIRMPDGSRVPTRHRFVTADAGYRMLDAGGQVVPIMQGAVPANEMQLLNGRGKPLHKPQPPTPVALSTPGAVQTVPDYYVTYKDRPLTVGPPGVLANDQAGAEVLSMDVTSLKGGTVVKAGDTGGFTYTPPAGYTGWDEFTYKAKVLLDESNNTRVFIHVRDDAGPVWLFFAPYEYADWTPLAPLLANW
jgi:hypothetical protein